MKATHMKKEEGKMSSRSRNGKNTYNLRKIQLKWSPTRQKAIYPIKKKTIELPCSSWRSPLSLCHSSCSAGRRQQEGSVTPPPPPPSRDPCSRRPEIQDPILNRGGASTRDPRIPDQISHGQGPTNQPAGRHEPRQDWIFPAAESPTLQPARAHRTTRESLPPAMQLPPPSPPP
jgi:hypothetical protein